MTLYQRGPSPAEVSGLPRERSIARIITLHLGEKSLVEFVGHVVTKTAQLKIEGCNCYKSGRIPAGCNWNLHVRNRVAEDNVAFTMQANTVDLVEIAFALQGYYQVQPFLGTNGRQAVEICCIDNADPPHLDVSPSEIWTGSNELVSMMLHSDHIISDKGSTTLEKPDCGFALA